MDSWGLFDREPLVAGPPTKARVQESGHLLNWQKIHDWASGKEPGYELGQSCTNSQCPLALYLLETTGRGWSVGPSIRRNDGSERLYKPTWVQMLLDKVDEGSNGKSLPVTREQFLEALASVKPTE